MSVKRSPNITIDPNLYTYCLENWLREAPILTELRHQTEKMPEANMQIRPLQGQFMAFLLKLINTNDVLEIGTYTGYSSLVMAQALPENGKVITCDINPEWTKIARKYWEKANVAHKIDLRLAPALETLKHLKEEKRLFDFIFIDADKTNYSNYYEDCLTLLRPSGTIAIDNVLWEGKVAVDLHQDPATLEIRKVNHHIFNDNRVEISLVPIADGLTLVKKR
jgi:predicted O-methyltransferase YrrM